MNQIDPYFAAVPDDHDAFPLDPVPPSRVYPPIANPLPEEMPATVELAERHPPFVHLLPPSVRAALRSLDALDDPDDAFALLDSVADIYPPRIPRRFRVNEWRVAWVHPATLKNAARSRGYKFELVVRGGSTRLVIGDGSARLRIYVVEERRHA